jgi:hypothetical protein
MSIQKAQAARIEKHLAKPMRVNGRLTHVREWLTTIHAEGGRVEDKQVDVIQDMSRARFNRADNQEQAEHARKQKAAGKKTEHRLFTSGDTFFVIGEIEATFFRSLPPKEEK